MGPLAFFTLINMGVFVGLSTISFSVYVAFNQLNPSNYGAYCIKDSDCNSKYYLLCQNNKCGCSSSYYNSSNVCVAKKAVYQNCSSNYECLTSLNCTYFTGLRMCSCPLSRYWNGSFCATKSILNQTCSNSYQCQLNSNMNCTNGICTCSNSVWNGTYCQTSLTYNQNCLYTGGCSTSQNLICITTGSSAGLCGCNTNYYYDQFLMMCVNQKLNGSTCSSPNQCLTSSGLTCINNVCTCPSSSYWNTTYTGQPSCVSYVGNGKSCVFALCDSSLLLTCSNGVCVCPINYYYTGSICAPYLSYGISCANSAICNSTLGLSCLSSVCQCTSTTTFWNGTLCTAKFTNGTYCTSNTQCNQALGLVCSSQNMCNCSISGQYWNGTQCGNYQSTVGSSCSSAIKCSPMLNLTCISGACACATGYYWMNSVSGCVAQLTYNTPCTASSQCISILTCIGSVCNCASGYYYDVYSFGCRTQQSYMGYCLATNQCNSTSSLTCQNNLCQCVTSTSFWNNGLCAAKYSSSAPCTFNGQCISNNCYWGFCA